jgi:peptide chain release factor subunit 3
MSDLNSWEDDPAAQDDNLSRQAQQQLNMNPAQAGAFQPGAASFQPGAQSFQPGQSYGGYMPQYQQQQQQQQQQQYYQQGYYQQYGGQQQQGFNQYNQGYGGGFSQGYGTVNVSMRMWTRLTGL